MTTTIPLDELEAERKQLLARIAECQRLRDLVAQLIAVSADLCQGRLQQRRQRAAAPDPGEKKPGRRSSGPPPPPNSTAS